jgi:hypothetical protein
MYKSEFVSAYINSKSTLPIETWEKCVGSKLPRFQSKDDIYAPVPIYVKICGGINEPQGTIKLSIPVTSDAWYTQLVQTLEKMTKKSGLNVYSNTGTCIKDMQPRQLFYAGECDLKNDKGKLIRLESLVQPPMKLSTNKNNLLKDWWNGNTDNLAKVIATKLKDMNTLELENACQVDGLVQNTIQTYLEKNVPNKYTWDEFIDNFGNDSNRTTSKDLAKKILSSIRMGMEHNEEHIQNYQAVASSLGAGKSMFKKTNTIKSKYKDGMLMYQEIMEDALNLPLLGKNIIHAIRYGTKTVSSAVTSVPKLKTQSDWHPLQSFYNNHYYGIHGKLPGHIMQAYNKNAGQVYTGFKGNAQEAINRFMLYSGRAIDPVQGIVGDWLKRKRRERRIRGKAKPNIFRRAIDRVRGYRDGRKYGKYRESDYERGFQSGTTSATGSKMPDLIPITREMPELIPIKKGPKLVDLDSELIEIPSDESLNKPLWKTLPSIADLLN